MQNSETTLFDILKARGVSRRWFAEQIGIHESFLSRIAKGKRKMPARYRAKAAQVLQIPEAVLFFEPNVPQGTSRVRKAS